MTNDRPYELRVINSDDDGRPFHVVAVSPARPDRTVAKFRDREIAQLQINKLNNAHDIAIKMRDSLRRRRGEL